MDLLARCLGYPVAVATIVVLRAGLRYMGAGVGDASCSSRVFWRIACTCVISLVQNHMPQFLYLSQTVHYHKLI